MATIEYVKEIDDLIKINTVFASATEKGGLFTNFIEDNEGNRRILQGLPVNGLLGVLSEVNPDALVISTGGTAKMIENAGYNVKEISDFTGWPEMETGLVKSMDPKLYVGMLAHPYTASDAEFMKKHKFPSIDMVLVNFYPFQQTVEEHPFDKDPMAFEIIRQNMDVGGPTAAHTSRKGFLTTAIGVSPEDYAAFAHDLKRYAGQISIRSRWDAQVTASNVLADYHNDIRNFMNKTTFEQMMASYHIVHNKAERWK